MRLAAGLALLLALAGPAQATCRLALALALDVSSSVDAREYRLQVDGLANALLDPDVQAAIFALPGTHIRLMAYEWSTVHRQTVLADWSDITDAARLQAFSAQLRLARQRGGDNPTGLGAAVLFGARALQRQPDCWQLKLDVSGDGTNNEGPDPDFLRDRPEMAGITVNALAIGADGRGIGTADRRQAEIKALLSYFQTRVITGPGAFAEAALTFDDYEAAMRRKLLRELQVMAVSSLDVVPVATLARAGR